MAEIVACPSCQRKLQVPEQYIGRQVQCPACRHMFTAESVSATPSSAPQGDGGRRRDDDYDDDDDLEHQDLRRPRDDYVPHRGWLILTLGVLSVFVCMMMGPIAWIMGNMDLREMHAGRMDPSGESPTRVGQVCGIVTTLIMILGILFFCFSIAVRTGRH